MKKTDVIGIFSRNNEIHIILREHKTDKSPRNHNGFNYFEVKKKMKMEAEKPLLLLRAE